ncbi:hypothetical protein [Candidatus Blastococcus massiliensis]|uniref:hypothetical protein n=1 Tax=Candidatus Blastococcus massiliensis TaxID=1470358 RepID=UPI0004B5F26C|nr:hypothetical protein [Candidatus Blastococcus massiliensis]
MKRALVAYGVVFVVLMMVSREFEAAGWTGVGALEIAEALVNSVLVLALVAAVLLAGRLGFERWELSVYRWRREQARAARSAMLEAEIIGVTSWRSGPHRPGPAPLPHVEPASAAPQPPSAGFTYVGPSYGHDVPPTPPFPEEPGRRF